MFDWLSMTYEAREVKVLEDGLQTPGMHTVSWDGHDQTGHKVASGVYVGPSGSRY